MRYRPVRNLAVLLAAAPLLVALGTAQEPRQKLTDKEVKAAIKLAEEKLEEGDLQGAGGWFLVIVTDYPERHDIQLRLARVYYELGQWESAARSSRIVAENLTGKEQGEAYAMLTDALLKNRSYEEAVEAGRKAVELNPSNAPVHANLAMSLSRTGSFEEAAQVAEKAIELDPTSASAHATVGDTQLAGGNVDEAQTWFQKAIELDPNSAAALVGMADIHLKKEEWDSAVTEASKALEADEGLSRAYAVRGLALNAQGNLAGAGEDLAVAVTLAGDDPVTQYAYAQVLEAQKNNGLAANHYRNAFRLDPALTEAGVSLGEIQIAQGGYKDAEQILTQVIEQVPDSAEAHFLLGTAQRHQDQLEAAIGEFARATELDPNLAAAYYWQGKLLLDKKQDVAGALPLLKKAAEIEGENASYLSDYGVALVNTQQFGEAVAVLSRAAADPEYADARGLYSLGAALLNTQGFAEAIEPFERAIEAVPNWGQPHIGLAWANFAQIKKGCPCGAEDEERVRSITEHYQKAVELGIQDPALQERVDILGRGEKIK